MKKVSLLLLVFFPLALGATSPKEQKAILREKAKHLAQQGKLLEKQGQMLEARNKYVEAERIFQTSDAESGISSVDRAVAKEVKEDLECALR